MEAADAGIKVIICITEGIPTADMVKVKAYLEEKECNWLVLTVQELLLQMKQKLVLCQVLSLKKESRNCI